MEPIVETGGIASPHDYRDGIVSAAVVAQLSSVQVPATYQTDLPPHLMQAQEPACVSHDAVDNLKLYWFRKTGEWVDFSPRFLDILAKRFDNQDRATGGTYPRLVFQLMAKYGCATEATLPNDTTLPVLQYRDDSLLTAAVFAEAAKYKTPGYVSIPLDFASTRVAVFVYGIVSALLQIGQEFWTNAAGQSSWADADLDPLRTPKVIVSGHQLGIKGWVSATLNTLRNEWSEAWANKGDANYDPHAWAPYVIEQWAIAEIPPDVTDFLKNLPAPAAFHYTFNTDLTLGDYSDEVRFAQTALMILGFLAPLTPDDFGHFGPKTAAAVLKYQQANRINPPSQNHIGPQTRAALNKQFSN